MDNTSDSKFDVQYIADETPEAPQMTVAMLIEVLDQCQPEAMVMIGVRKDGHLALTPAHDPILAAPESNVVIIS